MAPEEVVKGPCEPGERYLSVSRLRNGVGPSVLGRRHRPITIGAAKREISYPGAGVEVGSAPRAPPEAGREGGGERPPSLRP